MEFNTDKVVGAWVAFWNCYDLSLVDQLFLTDENVTYFSSEKEGLITGIEAIREHHKGFGFVDGGKESPNKLWVEDLHTTVFGHVAIVNGIWFFQREGTDPDKARGGPVTMVFVKVGDEYRIAHMNHGNY